MDILDQFGQRLMREVRDESLENWRMVLNGMMKGERAALIRSRIGAPSTDLSSILPDVVDSVLHWFLVWAESDPNVSLCWENNGKLEKLDAISDGLAGELYGPNGWVARYSQSPE